MITVDGGSSSIVGVGSVEVTIDGKSSWIECLVLEKMISGYPLLLGVYAIREFGGVRIGPNGEVRFGVTGHENQSAGCVAMEDAATVPDLVVEDTDFRAVFSDGAWSVRWKWSRNPEVGRGTRSCYEVPAEIRENKTGARFSRIEQI